MAPRVRRLDAELVRRGLARSRDQALGLISAGRVEVRGVIARKAASGIDLDTPVRVRPGGTDPEFASRGGYKLSGALDAFPAIVVEGRRCLDAGASTGGFTDVLLRRGAREVVAVDVGYGQLAWALQSDERVQIHDRTNVRALDTDQIGGPVELTVADLSFISLRLVLSQLTGCTALDGDLLPMVKPQFEVGKERLGSGGVVRDPVLRAEAVLGVADAANVVGWQVAGACASPLPGPSGNVEFFLWLRREPDRVLDPDEIAAVVTSAEAGAQ